MTHEIATTSTQVVPPRARGVLLLQNVSDTDIYIGFAAGVTTTPGPESGIKLRPNATLSLTDLPGSSGTAVNTGVWAVHAGTGTKELRTQEIQ